MYYLITVLFMLLDIVTGITYAFMHDGFKLSVMREGLYHKTGSIIIIALSVLIEYGQTFLDLGFTVPLSKGACVYICLMEIGLIMENITKINPELLPDVLNKIFGRKDAK